MIRLYITRISIEGFRGINNEDDPLILNFKPDSVNSIFAINGIGKSSIFEAFCYAIQGDVPKLKTLQVQERPQEYYCNRFHSQNKSIIELDFTPDDNSGEIITIRVERNSDGERIVTSPTGCANPEDLLQSLNEKFTLLDYGSFTKFIEDSPLDRGRSFSSLLGLSDYSDMRQALQSVSDTRSLNNDFRPDIIISDLSKASQSSRESLNILRINYEKVTGNTLDDTDKLEVYSDEIVNALKNIPLLADYFKERKLGEVDFDEVKKVIRETEGSEDRKLLEQVVEGIAKLQALGVPDESHEAEKEKLIKLVEERDELLSQTKGDLFKRLNESAKLLIDEGQWSEDNKCPLCESDLDCSIYDHIKDQLQNYQNVSDKIIEIQGAWSDAKWVQRLTKLERSETLAIEETERKITTTGQNILSGDVTITEIQNVIEWSDQAEIKLSGLLTDFETKKVEMENELPKSLVQLMEQVVHANEFKDNSEKYVSAQESSKQLRKQQQMQNRWQRFITRVSSAFSDAESALSQEKIADIDTEYKSMFKQVMNVGDVVPDLHRADEREDLHVQLNDFHGQHDLSARALLSESYRNALAISVFLAAATKNVGTPRFIVLDDITSSFDAGHQFNLMELIRTKLQVPNNTDGLQFVILSHDGLLEKYFDRLGNTVDWSHNRLQGSPPMGAVLNQSQDASRLKQNIETFLNAGQVLQAEPLIRQYLEYMLQKIIRKINIPVPIDFAIKDHSKMVQNCLDAITNAITLHQRAGTLVLTHTQVTELNTVHVPAIIGNWVSHYATGSASGFSAPVLQGVVDTIGHIEESFKYDDNSSGNVVRKFYRSLDRR